MTTRGLWAAGRHRVLLNLLLNCVQEQGALTPACPRGIWPVGGIRLPAPHETQGRRVREVGSQPPGMQDGQAGVRAPTAKDRANKDRKETEQARTRNKKGTTREEELKGRYQRQRGTQRRATATSVVKSRRAWRSRK